MTMMIQGCVMFLYVFLKGFQHQNVIHGKYKGAFILSYLMAAFEVACVTLVVQNGWASILPVGTGAAFGIVASMYAYRRINKIE